MDGQSILIVDDDPAMIKLLRVNLDARGFNTLIARDGEEALRAIGNDSPDLVILDIMLPKIDGSEVCQSIREWSEIPIIMLTALSETTSRVKYLNLGADDYITKPFAVDELMARISAVLRRNKAATTKTTKSSFTSGGLTINFDRRLMTIADREIRLTQKEYSLLQELALNADSVLTHAQLLNKVWGPEYSTEREYLREYISHLRAKIEPDPANPKYIITVPGVGYQFKSAT
jgi:two-component system KDP operon response regulator KdpE